MIAPCSSKPLPVTLPLFVLLPGQHQFSGDRSTPLSLMDGFVQGDGENLSFWILSTRMFPPVAAALPIFLIFKGVKLLDTHTALIIVNTIFCLPFVIWLLKGFFDELPTETEEAALIDGCTHWGVFARVALPLVTPGLVATSLFSFIFAWNEFMFALLLSRRTVRTLTVIVPSLVGGHEILWGEIAAIGTVAIIPGIVLSVLLQRYLVRGLTMGAVRG
jgi:multiple sugar transport system permease protein